MAEWTWLPNTGEYPCKRAYHSTNYVALRQEIVLFGGSHNGEKFNDVSCLAEAEVHIYNRYLSITEYLTWQLASLGVYLQG